MFANAFSYRLLTMVPETLFTLPVATGAVIVGPLIIGAAILALIGVGAVYLSGGRSGRAGSSRIPPPVHSSSLNAIP